MQIVIHFPQSSITVFDNTTTCASRRISRVKMVFPMLSADEAYFLLPTVLGLVSQLENAQIAHGSFLNCHHTLEQVQEYVENPRNPIGINELYLCAGWLASSLPPYKMLFGKLLDAISKLNTLLSEPYNY